MKKLLFILILALISLNSMAMGFPHSTVSQQRSLLSKSKKVDFAQNVKQVQTNIMNKVEDGKNAINEEKNSLIESVMESVGNFFIKVFTSVFSSNKSLAMNDAKLVHSSNVADIQKLEIVG